jgi:transposase InsO family protein
MSRPPTIPAEKKIRVVVSVLRGEVSVAEAARWEKVSEQAIGNWKRQFLDAGKSTARFCRRIDMPERTCRRWQAKARSARPPKGPSQLEFSEDETTTCGIWPIASYRDNWSKYEFEAHVSPTANMHDEVTGELLPVVTIVTENGGPFRSATFEQFIMHHPELKHVRTRVRTPGQNGSRERGFATMKYEWLFREEIAWNRPSDGQARQRDISDVYKLKTAWSP